MYFLTYICIYKNIFQNSLIFFFNSSFSLIYFNYKKYFQKDFHFHFTSYFYYYTCILYRLYNIFLFFSTSHYFISFWNSLSFVFVSFLFLYFLFVSCLYLSILILQLLIFCLWIANIYFDILSSNIHCIIPDKLFIFDI